MTGSRDRFMHLLKNEVLQLDQPDLDFGIYRILNFRRLEIEAFFDQQLPEVLEEAISQAGANRGDELGTRLPELVAKLEAEASELGLESAFVEGALVDALANSSFASEYQDVKHEIGELDPSSPFAESELDRLYNHLYTFFSRYYRDGDFEPQPRRSRQARYSVPYRGEDVHFYWRSFGSHYVKTSEELRSYQCNLGKRIVRFELVAAYEEPDNVKGNTRFFIPIVSDVEQRIEDGGSTFIVPMAFRRLTEKEEKKYGAKSELEGTTIQERIVAENVDKISPPEGVAKTDLLRHMRRYTARARRDYFVHPRLGSFLTNELEYYLVTEVLQVEAVTSGDALIDRLAKMKVIREVAASIISILDDLETVQSMLFEKARFVLSTEYIVRLDLINRDMWESLLQESDLRALWEDMLGSERAIDIDLLDTLPSLPVPTSKIKTELRDQILEGFENLDDLIDGLLVSGDNFGALRTIAPSVRGEVDLVYNDPPYNTGSDGFPYKDDFSRHSTWLSMVSERTDLCRELIAEDGALIQSIDENEHVRASMMLDLLFGERNRVADIIWKNSSKNDEAYVSVQHEYIIGAVKSKNANKGQWTELKEGLVEIYDAFDRFRREHGNDWVAIHEAALEFYRTLPAGHPSRDHRHYNWMDERGVYFASDISGPNFGQYRYDVQHPVTGETVKEPASGWRFPQEAMKVKIESQLVHFGPDHTTIPKNKTYLSDTEAQSLTSVKYRDGRVGSKALQDVLGVKAFDNPKDPGLLAQLFGAIGGEHALVLDAFAGSGSTGHAILNLNRKDGGSRRFVLIELDVHFDSVLLPRLTRLMLCPAWVKGVPQLDSMPSLSLTADHQEGSPRLMKVVRLERFDDSLNSIQSDGVSATQKLDLERPIRYLVQDVEQSHVFLSTPQLEHPFDYTLTVHEEGGRRSVKVDLPETFSLLAGIKVDKIRRISDADRRYLLVSGSSGESEVLVVWRDVHALDPARERGFLESEVPKLMGSDLSAYAAIWHNADSAIPNGKSLDAEFHRLMFEPVARLG